MTPRKAPALSAYHRGIDRFLRTRVGGWTALHVMNRLDKRLTRWSNGALNTGVDTDFRTNGVLLR
jgi:hypothetical protein